MDMRPSLLIVDDVPANISIMHSLLKEHYRILVAITGRRALEMARGDSPPDLILLDVAMPEMDGYQVCAALKADPRTREIPVLLVTANADIEGEARGFAVGCADYITKPISPPVLLARVRTHLILAKALQRWPDLGPGPPIYSRIA